MPGQAANIDQHLVDPFGREIEYLRVSVTDRCDFRCVYCMSEHMTFLPKRDLLSLEELDRLCAAFVRHGVKKLRITGGEPLVRKNIMWLFRALGRHLETGQLRELTLTTNGSQLEKFAGDLKSAGVNRINVSLDTIDPVKFKAITRWGDFDGGHARPRCGAEGRARDQDQCRGAQGRQRRRNRRSDPLRARSRRRLDADRDDAARRHRRRSHRRSICRCRSSARG